MRIGIVARKDNERAMELAAELYRDRSAAGVDVLMAPAAADRVDAEGVPVEELADCGLVVSIGGDGTFLYTARHVGSTPILGVNLGEVGFLNAVSPADAVDRVREETERIRETGRPRYREVPRLEATGDGGSLPPGLNEIAVVGPQRGRGRGLEVEVSIDGSPYTAGHADGALVATQTGSTAYNLSEGGPLVHPTADGLIVTTMCASESMPPLVVGTDVDIAVRATGADYAVVTSDGQREEIDTPARVGIGLADEPGRIAGPRSDFFEALGKIDRKGKGKGKGKGKA